MQKIFLVIRTMTVSPAPGGLFFSVGQQREIVAGWLVEQHAIQDAESRSDDSGDSFEVLELDIDDADLLGFGDE